MAPRSFRAQLLTIVVCASALTVACGSNLDEKTGSASGGSAGAGGKPAGPSGAGAGGSSGAPAACQLSANVIDCVRETFDECATVDCTNGCSVSPSEGCQIAPGMVLIHFGVKPPNDFYLCDGSSCGTWSETPCQVTVSPDDGGSIEYTIRDSTCPWARLTGG